ncbi:MAG TPA: DNA-3-methyladenine glycosylase [Gemmatimonadales bacterium]|nr:DNA-3-methyladenine glycosylase [Gemmatimonadales bacterium]
MAPKISGAAVQARFYARPTEEVARGLLGRILVSDVDGRRTAGRIVEVEAYVGPHDPACHAYGLRRTARTEPLYGRPGTAYVYFTYGMHWCLNAVTEPKGFPAAVLIRALEPLQGLDTMRERRETDDERLLCKGPARLCDALGVTGDLNRASLQRGALRILEGTRPRGGQIVAGPRVGITQARDWPLRFYLKGSPWVSAAR